MESMIEQPFNKPLELTKPAGMPLAYARVTPASPLPLLLRRRGFGRALQLSGAFCRHDASEALN